MNIDVKIDLLYLARNRRAFTVKTLDLLKRNTNWSLVDRLFLYDDDSEDGTSDALASFGVTCQRERRVETHCLKGHWGGPVAVMNHFLDHAEPELFCKIDNDTAVPPNWLEVCNSVMNTHSELELLGIEAMSHPVAAGAFKNMRTFTPSSHIGGIGLMRARAFAESRPKPRGDGRFGFTEWQQDHPEVVRGWVTPALPVALLDRIPCQPWSYLTEEYVRRGWARAWPPYPAESHADWEWVTTIEDREVPHAHG